MKPIRTRFAPSPTGDLHIGGARTALYAYLAAKTTGGEFVLRIEDTDSKRNQAAAVDGILNGLRWLGIDWDQGPYFQSQRMDRYRAVVQDLLDKGLAYYAYEDPLDLDQKRKTAKAAKETYRYDGYYRDKNAPFMTSPHRVVRFKNPIDGVVQFHDMVKGDMAWRNQDMDDLILWRSDDTPTYNFAVVVDDLDMGITHVIRGDDHLSNTPRQINLYKAMGVADADIPTFAHISMIYNKEGKKLSKRDGAASVLVFKDAGYVPDGIISYLARLGWSHGDQELFSRDDLMTQFDIQTVHPSPARFDYDKLKWVNQQFLQTGDYTAFQKDWQAQLLAQGILVTDLQAKDLFDLYVSRESTLLDMAKSAKVLFDHTLSVPPLSHSQHLPLLRHLQQVLGHVDGQDWNQTTLEGVLKQAAKDNQVKFGEIAHLLRDTLVGTHPTPGIYHVLTWMGHDLVLKRIEHGIQGFLNDAKIGPKL